MRPPPAASIDVIVNSSQRNENLGLMSRLVFVSFDHSSASLWFFFLKKKKNRKHIMVAQRGKRKSERNKNLTWGCQQLASDMKRGDK